MKNAQEIIGGNYPKKMTVRTRLVVHRPTIAITCDVQIETRDTLTGNVIQEVDRAVLNHLGQMFLSGTVPHITLSLADLQVTRSRETVRTRR